jgi:hypothetical protein
LHRAAILGAAAALTTGDRQDTYGSAAVEFARLGEVWGALLRLEEPVPAATVAAMLTGLKLVRATANPGHVDSWVDAAGYAALGGEIGAGDH